MFAILSIIALALSREHNIQSSLNTIMSGSHKLLCVHNIIEECDRYTECVYCGRCDKCSKMSHQHHTYETVKKKIEEGRKKIPKTVAYQDGYLVVNKKTVDKIGKWFRS